MMTSDWDVRLREMGRQIMKLADLHKDQLYLEDLREIRMYIDAFEIGVALESLCAICEHRRVSITLNEGMMIFGLAEEMGLAESPIVAEFRSWLETREGG